MILPSGERIERIPAWIRRAVQDLSHSTAYDGVFWNPPQKYIFKHKSPPRPSELRIYEAHVGIASPEMKCATYVEFANNVLPRIHSLGMFEISNIA